MGGGGGGAIRNPKKNQGIDFHSGFRKTSQGGGGGNTKSYKIQVLTFIKQPNQPALMDSTLEFSAS